MANDEKIIKIYESWLKKPIILAFLMYASSHLGFILLLFIQNFSISLYEILSNTKINPDEDITLLIKDFLSFTLAILLICIIYSQKYKEQLSKKAILKISFYFPLIGLAYIKLKENFAIPFDDWNSVDLIINDFVGLVLGFLGTFGVLWISNKIGYALKDFYFNKIFPEKLVKEVIVIILAIILGIIYNSLKHKF
ncbi:MAG: hypothetical protein A2Y25_02055 [Candidatus Melainabacteria bacterium GWF2_37_15]|nr:MAG: hypothetical protein A2Y25_02055 [Candidatus Melainabacteria bacterium GWF2_37_15]